MSAEGKPQAEFSLLGTPLKLVTVLVARFPVSVIIASGLLLALCLTSAQLSLGFRTSRSDLLNPKSEYNRRWAEYTKEFGEQDDVTVVVRSDDPRVVPPILDELAGELNRQPKRFRSVVHRLDADRIRSKGLYNDKVSLAYLQQINGFLAQCQGLLRGDFEHFQHRRAGSLVRLADRPGRSPLCGDLRRRQQQQVRSLSILETALRQSGPYQSPYPEMSALLATQADRLGNGYKLIDDGRVGLLALYLAKNDKNGNFTEFSDGLTELRQIVSDARARHPGVRIGLTGLPVMENDEMESSQATMTTAGVLSFIGVGLLYVAGFGCVRHPAMALIALFVPMGWAFGYILLTVKHLNILSSAFATIVIGLGSDYGVYHISQYLRYRAEKMSTFDALLATARTLGPGLTTSAVATAAAFYSIGLSDFPGIAELGIIAGGGILLCWLAALTTLPAMISWSDTHRPPWRVPAPLDVYAFCRPLVARPKLVVAGYLVLTGLICVGLKDLWYDHNLLHLQVAGLESVELEQLLLRSDCGASYAVVVAKSREEVLQRQALYADRKLCPMVDSVTELGSYVSAGVEQNAR